MKTPAILLSLLVSASCVWAEPKGTSDVAAAPASPKPADYLEIVHGYVDAMIEHGRDHYGEQSSPLFASFLKLEPTIEQPRPGDRNPTNRILLPPFNLPGYRTGDRMWTAANVMHDENLYQIMYALAKTTGQKRYADEADRTLKWFFEHGQSKETGLFAWGEHLGWDFWDDKPGCSYFGVVTEKGPKPDHYGGIHEFYRPWALWPRSFELAPEACSRFARGLWENQIFNQKTGAFSRHAYYGWRGPGGGYEFPRHAGFYIATWAQAYERTKDEDMLHAIETLVDMFTASANPKTGALPAGLGDDVKLITWPMSDLSLAIDLHDAAQRVPRRLAAKMRALARRIDTASVGVPHDLKTPGKGFVVTAEVGTLKPGNPYLTDPIKIEKFDAYTKGWSAGYGGGNSSHANAAMMFLERYRQTGVAGHKKLVVQAADTYLQDVPKLTDRVYPVAMGEAIFLLTETYKLTREKRYLEQADLLAARAVEMYFVHGPIPRILHELPYYETITGPDTLAMALLNLWYVQHQPKTQSDLVWTDR